MEHGQFSPVEKQAGTRPLFFGLFAAAAIGLAGAALPVSAQQQLAHSSDQDICAQPSFQAKLIAKFNSAPQLTEQYGRLLRVESLRNELHGAISCRGKYFFSDDVEKDMAFGFEPDGANPSIAGGIPNKCKTDDTDAHIVREVPRILDLGPNAAEIAKVEFLADVPRTTYYPARGQAGALHMLQCPVTITWTNGHQDMGYYMEWEDHHQQVRVSFTANPVAPPSRDY